MTPRSSRGPFDFDDDLSHFKWALATAETYRNIGLQLWKKERPDTLLVYIEATDSTSHLFGHLFRRRASPGSSPSSRSGTAAPSRRCTSTPTGSSGDFLAAMDDDTTLVVLSDHGFELGALPDDPSKTRDMRRVSEQFHRVEGILYLYGPAASSRARGSTARRSSTSRRRCWP